MENSRSKFLLTLHSNKFGARMLTLWILFSLKSRTFNCGNDMLIAPCRELCARYTCSRASIPERSTGVNIWLFDRLR